MEADAYWGAKEWTDGAPIIIIIIVIVVVMVATEPRKILGIIMADINAGRWLRATEDIFLRFLFVEHPREGKGIFFFVVLSSTASQNYLGGLFTNVGIL